MRIVCQTFSLPKSGREFADYEDAYFPCNPSQLAWHVEEKADAQTFRTTVCDGATDSCFSGYWAELLAAGYGASQWSEDVSEATLVPAQKTWQQFLAKQELPWFAEEKAKLGAFAAVVGLTLEQGGAWKATAIGDCCIFQTRQGRLVEAFPIKSSSEFDNFPFLIGSLPERNGGVFEHKMTKLDGRWEAGDIFFLMSDAIACWFLKTTEGGPGAQAIAWLGQLNNHAAFSELVAAERQELSADGLANMKDDDVTFVKVVVDGRPLDLAAPGAQAAAAPHLGAQAGRPASNPGAKASPPAGSDLGAQASLPASNPGTSNPGAQAPSPASNPGASNAVTRPLVSRPKDSTHPIIDNQGNRSSLQPPAKAAPQAGASAPGVPGAAPPARPDPPKPSPKSAMPVPPIVEPASRPAAPPPTKSAKPPAEKPSKLIISCAIAALAAVGGIVAMLSHGPAKPKPGAGAAVNEAPHPHPLAKKAASDTAGSGEKPAVTAAGKAHKGATIDPISALHFGQEPGAKHSPPKPKEDMPAPAPNRQPAEPPKTQAPNDNTEPQPAPQRNENNPGASSNPVPPNPVAQVPAPAAPAPAPQARPARHARLAPGTTDGAAKPASHSKATDDSDSGIRAFGTDSRKKRKNSSLDFDTNAPEKMPETAPSFEPGDKKEPTDPQ